MNNLILKKKTIKINNYIILLNKSVSVIFLNLKHINVNNLSTIRKICKKYDCISKVVNKKLFLKSILKSKFQNFENIDNNFNSSLIIFSFKDIGFITRILSKEDFFDKLLFDLCLTDFFIKNQNIKEFLISYPTFNESIIKLINTIKYCSYKLLHILNILKSNK